MGEKDVASGVDLLQRHKIPHYILPESMCTSFKAVYHFHKHLKNRAHQVPSLKHIESALARKLMDQQPGVDPFREAKAFVAPDKGVAVIKALDVVVNYIRRMPAPKQQEYVIRYLKDFLTFRRDLKLAYYSYQQMSKLENLRPSPTDYHFKIRQILPTASKQRL